ncbi:mast cell protease 4-like [Garra rufa]|uniref:mast cell protease 4-like n=1 Tax=Garra rufa TaxID=137080 RepID=UPI003CCE9503
MAIISLLLLVSLLPHLTFTARVNVGIVNGWEAKPHSRPYMVSVQRNWLHTCGGFLVSDEFVLTAAHCRENSQTLTVVVGAHDLKNKTEGSVYIGVKSYHKHPNFTTEPVMNDIMLLRLEKKVTQNENANWISIPVKEEETVEHSVCSVAGWGRLDTIGSLSSRLMETHVKIMDNTKCENKWGQNDYLASEMMCTYGNGGSCTGDSGGPLVCGKTAVGVTSFGDPDLCNSPKHPEVYMKVSAYLPWIHKFIKNLAQEPTTELIIAPKPEPLEWSDQVCELATSPVPRGVLVENEGFDRLVGKVIPYVPASPELPMTFKFPPSLSLLAPVSSSALSSLVLISPSAYPQSVPSGCSDLLWAFQSPGPPMREDPVSTSSL